MVKQQTKTPNVEDDYYIVRENEIIPGISLESFIETLHKDGRSLLKLQVPKKWIRNTYISLFNKPAGDIVCPHFWELKPFIGCPFKCSYCYLQGTFFGKKEPRRKDYDKMVKVLEEFLSWANTKGIRLLLNTGELADSLAIPSWTKEFIDKVLPILEKYKYHKVLFLSKGGTYHIKTLLEIPEDKRKYFIVSFSINPPIIKELFEHETADPLDRLKAAKKLQELGYTVRIRIDPMIPVEGWRAHYTILVKTMFEDIGLIPERITIGSLRGLAKTIKYSSARNWLEYLKSGEKTRWGLKIKRELRLDMYTIVIEKIGGYGFKGPIALCKETLDVWNELSKKGLLQHPGRYGIWENVHCNCKL